MVKHFNIVYNGTEIKHYVKLKHLGCLLDQSVCAGSMALNVIDKGSLRLKFLQRQNRFLTLPLRRLFCNALIQPLFQYVCTAWFSKFSKILELPLQVSQNKCMRFCLHLDKRSKIRVKRFLQLIDTYNSLSPISLNFTTITVQTILMNFSVLLVKIV